MKNIHNAPASPDTSSSLVNVSQVADLAGVSRPAVSNWRARFEDFPKPVQAVPGGRDLFRLEEVERWLRDRGRLGDAGKGRQSLFRAADLLRGDLPSDSTTETLGAVLALIALARRSGWSDRERWDLETLIQLAAPRAATESFEPLRKLGRKRAEELIALLLRIDEEELAPCFEWLLDRQKQQGRRGRGGSGEAQVELLRGLIAGAGGVVYDPAAGFGGFLLAAAGVVEEGARLIGQEVNHATANIARQRFAVHDVAVALADGDVMTADMWPELRADLVVCDPPYGQKRKLSDLTWLEHALHHLVPGGRAYVYLSPGSLFRSGAERDLRSRLLRARAVEAVVSLPAGAALHTAIPIVLWVLRQPDGSGEPGSVLLVDAMATGAAARDRFVPDAIPRIVSVLSRWRRRGTLAGEDRSIAAAVSADALIHDRANMVPARWIHQDPSDSQREERRRELERGVGESRSARRALQAELDLGALDDLSAEWVTVERLVGEGLVEILGGTAAKPDRSLSDGVQLLRTRDLLTASGERQPPAFLAPEAASKLILTEPGDVVVSPASGTLRTFVDREGGRALARPLQALRFSRSSMEPSVVTAFLEAPRNRRFLTGSAHARVALRDLELPLLEAGDAERLARALAALDEQERIGAELAVLARALRRAMVSLAAPKGEAGKGGEWKPSS